MSDHKQAGLLSNGCLSAQLIHCRFADDERNKLMTDQNEELGSIDRIEDGFEAHLERFMEHPQEAVWAMLTEPSRMIDWLAPGEIELRKGGTARLNFTDSGIVIDSLVSEFDPPHLLEYSWSSPGEPDRPVRWQTSPAGDGTRLSLTLKCPADEDIARSCAGWEAHLMMLLAAIEGVPIKFPFERFQSTRDAYNRMIGQ
jgi:uncharacterized protein YndB with AHSA1/START domain